MITLGIDLSSQPKGTAACRIEWRKGGAVVRAPREGCTDADLDGLIAEADAVGIDAPFGWPSDFAEGVTAWNHTAWNNALRDRMRFRETDRFVHERLRKWPLSVSTDRVALPAMRAMALLRRHGLTDLSGGDARFFEVYPAGSLLAWGLDAAGYKSGDAEAVGKRKELLTALRDAMPWLVVSDDYAATDHNLDALVASLTARSAAKGNSLRPPLELEPAAHREGWIHLPNGFPQPQEYSTSAARCRDRHRACHSPATGSSSLSSCTAWRTAQTALSCCEPWPLTSGSGMRTSM